MGAKCLLFLISCTHDSKYLNVKNISFNYNLNTKGKHESDDYVAYILKY